MSIITTSFYWRNDTPSFVTWRSRLSAAPDTSTCIVVHGGQFTGRVHPPNKFVPEIVSPLPCSPALVRHTLLFFFFFFKELISFIGALDKCHTSVFNALIFLGFEISCPRTYTRKTQWIQWCSNPGHSGHESNPLPLSRALPVCITEPCCCYQSNRLFFIMRKHYCDKMVRELTLSPMTNFGLFQTERVCRRQF